MPMLLASMSKDSTTTNNYDLAQWLSVNSDDIRPTIMEILNSVLILTGSVSIITAKATIESTLRRFIYQNSGLGLRVDEVIILLEDAGVQQIIDFYYTDPIMRRINNETN